MSNTPKTALIISILWPSFLTACGATAVFFTLFDPWSLQVPPPLDDLSRIGAYTVGFFLFWLLTATTSLITYYYQASNTRNTRDLENHG